MKIVGLTGGIGSGKTTVAKMFAELGVPVYNSDLEAKKLMHSSKTIRNKLKILFGESAYLDGKLNRGYIAKSVFNDQDLLKALNGIVHPAVRRHFKKWCKKQDHSYVIQETALLFENRAQDLYDKIILVVAPKEVRIDRLLERDQSTREDILARMENQLEDKEKIPLADFIIKNTNLEKTGERVTEVNRAILDSY
ncbi:dephospho-CoA kinase [Maribacter cobaltidurans]|uniref:Dephospho-CoA kinase n=1 Tax=Maribacter cobaltidurans TaxID=1178778 RepID=A0A223V9C8_9FLAO|nr:dephospho-CoA kinase [Maribacter cobaltidurans]ASV31991.1 dephospho-CoA kinase [Maribacter cobaltidurans]